MTSTTINIYQDAGEWYGARWIAGEYDGCDVIDAETEEEARATVLREFPGAEIVRVDDDGGLRPPAIRTPINSGATTRGSTSRWASCWRMASLASIWSGATGSLSAARRSTIWTRCP